MLIVDKGPLVVWLDKDVVTSNKAELLLVLEGVIGGR